MKIINRMTEQHEAITRAKRVLKELGYSPRRFRVMKVYEQYITRKSLDDCFRPRAKLCQYEKNECWVAMNEALIVTLSKAKNSTAAGSRNYEIRILDKELCIRSGIPWQFAACTNIITIDMNLSREDAVDLAIVGLL